MSDIAGEVRGRIEKTITTPNKDKIFAILDIRMSGAIAGGGYNVGYVALKNVSILQDSVTLTFIGKPYDATSSEYIPRDKWIRVVVPLPKNTTITLKIVVDSYGTIDGYFPHYLHSYLWLDDFKIISK